MERRLAQIEESVARYLSQLDTADLQDPTEALAAKTAHLKEKLAKLATELQRWKAIDKEMLASPDQQISLTRESALGGQIGRVDRGPLLQRSRSGPPWSVPSYN
jgi:hypothetical protein